MDIGKLKAASETVENAEWVGDLPGLGDAELCVRSPSAPAVVRALGRAMRQAPQKDREDDGSLTVEAQDRIELDVTASHVLEGWRGLTDDGKPVEFGRELAREWLGIGLFEQAVRVASSRVQGKANAALESLRGNSPAPSKKP